MKESNGYTILRTDLEGEPVTVEAGTLLVGRTTQCHVLLNHPSVSRVQAAIKQYDGNYYLFCMRPSNPVLLNGKPVSKTTALAAGDMMEVGPFTLEINHSETNFIIIVSLPAGRGVEIEVSQPDSITRKLEPLGTVSKNPRPTPLPATLGLDIYWDQRMRSNRRIATVGPLSPQNRRQGKAQFTWKPTSDLLNNIPISYLIWSAILGTILLLFWFYSG